MIYMYNDITVILFAMFHSKGLNNFERDSNIITDPIELYCNYVQKYAFIIKNIANDKPLLTIICGSGSKSVASSRTQNPKRSVIKNVFIAFD